MPITPGGGGELPDINGGTVLGNGGTVAGQAYGITLGAGATVSVDGQTVTFGGGGLAIGEYGVGSPIPDVSQILTVGASIINQGGGSVVMLIDSGTPTLASGALFGNGGTAAGAGGDILGNGITVSGTTATTDWNAGVVTDLGTGLSLSGGTLDASGGGGGIGSIVASGITNTATSQALTTIPFVTPVLTTWYNQGSATATVNLNGPLVLTMPTVPGTNIVARYKALPVGAFTLIANLGMIGANSGTASPSAGLILTDGTKVAAYQGSFLRAQPQQLNLDLWSNASSVSGLASGLTYNIGDNLWQRIVYDGIVTYTWSFSHDGFSWIQQFSTTIVALTFAPTGAGIGLESFSSIAAPYIAAINYWAGV